MSAIVMVEITVKDHERVLKRIKMLDGVKSVKEHEEIHRSGVDIHVSCAPGTSKFDVEELLNGVAGVEVEVVS
jgi:hypothetical protein